MKRYLLLLTITTLFSDIVSAQVLNETHNDSTLQESSKTYISPPTVKEYGGFLLDLGTMSLAPTLPPITSFKIKLPDASKDYSTIFKPNTDAIYTSGYHTFGFPSYAPTPYMDGFFSNNYLQMGSFRLKNGWRLNTYGEYDKDGWRMPTPSALPWQKDNFKGAFELKSANGSFGIRVEVRKGHEWPF